MKSTSPVSNVSPDRERVDAFRRKHRIALLTMLFTDLVGSTKLKQILGDQAAIKRPSS